MEDPNAIPLPIGTGYIDPKVAYTPQGMAYSLTVPQKSILKKPLSSVTVHNTPPGPPCTLSQPMSDSEYEDQDESEPARGKVHFVGQETKVINEDDDFEPVEIPANLFSGERAMGVLPPGMVHPPLKPTYTASTSLSRFGYGTALGPSEAVISANSVVIDVSLGSPLDVQ
ncbi:hypothetical protein QR680_003473 [Steinernema hermaphroditum]|uniref:Uncharacterized protein n=1 Tax=Steinernema hermaphroditum TaxID=289476 RepID=A0AA39H7W0_9BILA|nr:hypothetical protein QR680_003473 [Steinernema hermaphroditum]